MTREQVVTTLAGLQRAWNQRDAAGLAAAHAEEAVVISPIFGEVRGREAIERSYRDLFIAFSDWMFQGQELIIDGHRAAQVFTVTATHTSELFGVPATQRRFEIHGMLVFEFRDGKIVHERRLYDFTALLIQLGVLKAKPARG
jgi:steroid delta-isomerase-like uncharacterized protein